MAPLFGWECSEVTARPTLLTIIDCYCWFSGDQQRKFVEDIHNDKQLVDKVHLYYTDTLLQAQHKERKDLAKQTTLATGEVGEVTGAAAKTSDISNMVSKSAEKLFRLSTQLNTMVGRFKI